jgi:hypothetical protein
MLSIRWLLLSFFEFEFLGQWTGQANSVQIERWRFAVSTGQIPTRGPELCCHMLLLLLVVGRLHCGSGGEAG